MTGVDVAASLGGALLEAATRVLANVRTATKPLHPRGTVWEAEITRIGAGIVPIGVRWLDEPGRDEALVRMSAAVGLPPGWPDIQGLAVRVVVADGFADVLLASTGAGRVTRFLLRPVRASSWHLVTTLLPYRSPAGPILLAAVPTGPQHYALLRAGIGSEWSAFGGIRLVRRSDREPSFDPIRNPLPGLPNYAWVTRLREPAYRAARAASRTARAEPTQSPV